MPSRHFTADYVERVTLRDGTSIVLRLLAPEDRAVLRRGFDKLSAETRYARFLVPKQRLNDDELHYLCDVDQENHFALGAILEASDGSGEPVGIGIARFIRLPTAPGEFVTAEAAITVADEMHNKGVGKVLFLRLCSAAVERGIQHFRCEVLGNNRSMQALIAAVAPNHSTAVGSGVTSIDFVLPDVPSDASPAAPPPSVPMYAFFRAAAANLIEWTEAVREVLASLATGTLECNFVVTEAHMFDGKMARALGATSIGIGVAELLAPHWLDKKLGVRDHPVITRVLGARDIIAGVGSVAQPERRLWSVGRLAGHVARATLLGVAVKRSRRRAILLGALGAIVAIGVLDGLTARKR